MRRFFVGIAVLAVAVPSVLVAQEEFSKPGPVEDKQLDRYVGAWEGKGTHLGASVKARSQSEWVLNHQFVRTQHRLEASDGSFHYEAVGYYKPLKKEGKFSMIWIDDFGLVTNGDGQSTTKGAVLEWVEKHEGGSAAFKMETTFGDKACTDVLFMNDGQKWVEAGKIEYRMTK